MKQRKAFSAISTLALLLLISTCPTDSLGTTDAVGMKSSRPTVDPSLAKSVTSVMFGHKEKKIFLIDIRPAKEFKAYHIPGALNIPLFAIKTKAYLKSKPLVLVNGGYVIGPLARTCRILNQKGYRAAIMAGGLCAWKAKGGPLSGDHFSQREMNAVTPIQFQQERLFDHQVTIQVAEKPTGKKPDSRTIHLTDTQNAIARIQLAINTKSANPFSTLILLTESGRQDHRLRRLLADAGLLHHVFILKGGRKAFETHLAHTALTQKPRNERRMRTDGCRSCGRE